MPAQTSSLDPWVASSLLQKAIRRGELELAVSAVRTLYRHRGTSVFRRLCIIAVEDIGIADVRLLREVVYFGTHKEIRSVLGADLDLLIDLSSRMAMAAKDRSADYLYCAATKLENAKADRAKFATLPLDELLLIAVSSDVPMPRRAVAALMACTSGGGEEAVLVAAGVRRLLDALPVQLQPLHAAVLDLTKVRSHPFCVMLPLIWSRWWEARCPTVVTSDRMPPIEKLNGMPLYALDKHTAAGKRAIARFARENVPVATLLDRHVLERHRTAVAAIAAFYADAAPVCRRLDWPTGAQLKQAGAYADTMDAGCPFEAVPKLLRCVRENLGDLNRLRAEEFASRK